MKKVLLKSCFLIINVIIICFYCFTNVTLKAYIGTNYDFIPMGINYLDVKNLEYTILDDGYVIKNIETIRIKEKIDYKIFVLDENINITAFYYTTYSEGDFYYSSGNNVNAPTNVAYTSGDQGVEYIDIEVYVRYNDPNNLNTKCQIYMCEETVDIDSLTYQDLIYQGEFGYTIIEEEYDYYTYASNPITMETLNQEIKAVDDVDGDVSSNIEIIENTYVNNIGKVGVFKVKYSVMDKAGNPSVATINIHVIDDIFPVIEGVEEISCPHTDIISINDIKELLKASDNHLGNITNQITLVSDNYTENSKVPGSYEVIFGVSDGINETTHTVMLNVYYNDITAPVFTGSFSYEVGNNQNISREDLIKEITVSDDYDEELAIEFGEDNYTSNIGKIGFYSFEIFAVDSKGNKTTQIITVSIVDKTPPIFMIVTKHVYLEYRSNRTTTADIVRYLQTTKNLDKNLEYEVVYDEYSENKNTPGEYRIIFKNGNTKTGVVVHIVERLHQVEVDVSFITRVKTFFKNIFSGIKDFFISIF